MPKLSLDFIGQPCRHELAAPSGTPPGFECPACLSDGDALDSTQENLWAWHEYQQRRRAERKNKRPGRLKLKLRAATRRRRPS